MPDQRKYGAYSGFRGYAASTFKRFSRDRKLNVITKWFLEHFEDPANRVSYNGREGGYLWVPGLGPEDANEQIQEQFSDVAEFALMSEAVERVQADGTLDWASKDYFSESPDESGFPYTLPITFGAPTAGTAPSISRGVFEHGVFEPGVFEEDTQPNPPNELAARREMLERLERVEKLIEPLSATIGMMGHNGPPGPIEDPALQEIEPNPAVPPLTSRDLDAIKSSIEELRIQAKSIVPDLPAAVRSQGVLRRAAAQLERWLLMAADEAVKAAGKAAGVLLVAGAVVSWQYVAPALEEAATSVSLWVKTIEVP